MFPNMSTSGLGYSQDLRAIVKDFPNPVLATRSGPPGPLTSSSSFDASRRCKNNLKRTFLTL